MTTTATKPRPKSGTYQAIPVSSITTPVAQLPRPIPTTVQIKTREDLLSSLKNKKQATTVQVDKSRPSKFKAESTPKPAGTPVKHSFCKLIKMQINSAKEMVTTSNNVRLARKNLQEMTEIDPLLVYKSNIENEGYLEEALQQAPDVFSLAEYWVTRSVIEEKAGDLESAVILIPLASVSKAQPLRPILDRIQILLSSIKYQINPLQALEQKNAKNAEKLKENILSAIHILSNHPLISSKNVDQLAKIRSLLVNAPKKSVAPVVVAKPKTAAKNAVPKKLQESKNAARHVDDLPLPGISSLFSQLQCSEGTYQSFYLERNAFIGCICSGFSSSR